MPDTKRYFVERQFLVPHYQHIAVEAASIKEACEIACDDSRGPSWDSQHTDYDGSRDVYVTRVVEDPEGEDPTELYDYEEDEVPEEFQGDEAELRRALIAVVEDLRATYEWAKGGVTISTGQWKRLRRAEKLIAGMQGKPAEQPEAPATATVGA